MRWDSWRRGIKLQDAKRVLSALDSLHSQLIPLANNSKLNPISLLEGSVVVCVCMCVCMCVCVCFTLPLSIFCFCGSPPPIYFPTGAEIKQAPHMPCLTCCLFPSPPSGLFAQPKRERERERQKEQKEGGGGEEGKGKQESKGRAERREKEGGKWGRVREGERERGWGKEGERAREKAGEPDTMRRPGWWCSLSHLLLGQRPGWSSNGEQQNQR